MRLLCIILLLSSLFVSAQEVSKHAGPDAGALARALTYGCVIDILRSRLCDTVAKEIPQNEPPKADDLVIDTRFFSVTKRAAAKFSFDFAWYTLMLHHNDKRQLVPACYLGLKQTCMARLNQFLEYRLSKMMSPPDKNDRWYKRYSKTYTPTILASSFILVTNAYLMPKLLSLKQ